MKMHLHPVRILFLICMSIAGPQSYAQTADGSQSLHQTTAVADTDAAKSLPAGTFSGDDIQLKLDTHGKFLLTGGAVEKPTRGSWSIQKKGSHTLLRLVTDNKHDDNWLFGVRSKNTLQIVDQDKLSVLDKPLNIYEDVGVLTRAK